MDNQKILFLGHSITTGEEITSIIVLIVAGVLMISNLDPLSNFFLRLNQKESTDDNSDIVGIFLIFFAIGLFVFAGLIIKDLIGKYY